MPKHWLLVTGDGREEFVFTPPILGSRNNFLSQEIQLWQRRLLETIVKAEIPLWEPDQADGLCFAHAGQFYSKIAKLLKLEAEVEELNPESRHTFFVCNAPASQSDGATAYGLSGLEQILGYAVVPKSIGNKPPKKSRLSDSSTGSEELDVLTTTLLIFKRKGWEMGKTFGAEDLAKMNRLASEMMKPVDEDLPEDGQTEDTSPDSPVLIKHKAKVLEALKAKGIIPPKGF